MGDEKLPWFKFYPADFMGSGKVQMMGPAERGIYISLLCWSWQEGPIPDDPKIVARIAAAEPDTMREAWPLVRETFTETEDGRLVHPRLEKERAAALARREAARKAANARHAPDDASADASEGADGGAPASADGGAMRASDASDAQSTETVDGTDVQTPAPRGGFENDAERDWAIVLTKLRNRREKILDQLSDDGTYALQQIGGMDTLTGSRVDDVRHIRRDFMNVHPKAS